MIPSSPRIVGPRPRDGFALLITIVLVSFLVLILVALASLTRVETSIADNSQKVSSARANALLALNVALGQLQVYAGPDQRVTATADFGDGATATAGNGLVTPNSGARQWVGAWGNASAANDIYGATPAPVLLNWLVSGNEQTTAPSVATDGHIAAATAASASYRPNATINNLSTASSATDGSITVNGTSAVILVGPDTAGTNTGLNSEPALDRYVVAPLVEIKSSSTPGVTGTNTIGRYAYWVGDNGVKAQYNLRDKLTAGDPQSDASADARYRLLSPARNGIEVLTGQSTYPWNNASLDKVATYAQLSFADSNLTENVLGAYVPYLNTGSWGVLADSQFGGLRTDLTHALNQGAIGTNFTGKTIVPDIDGATLSTSVPNGSTNNAIAPEHGADWATLKSFHDLTVSAGAGGPVQVRPAGATDMGVSPVIIQNRLMLKLITVSNGATGYPSEAARFDIQAQPLFVLGNPYTFPITAANGVEFSYGITTSTPDRSEWGIAVRQNAGSGVTNPISGYDRNNGGEIYNTTRYQYQNKKANVAYFPILANKLQHGETNSVLDNVKFKTPAFTLQPGEAITFTLQSGTSGSGNAVRTLNLQQGVNPSSFYQYNVNNTFVPRYQTATKQWSYLIELVSAEAMTLQMAMPGSDPADGRKSQPQDGVLQAVVNNDLSARNAGWRADSTGTYYVRSPFPGFAVNDESLNISPSKSNTAHPRNYITLGTTNAESGVEVMGYAFWITMPEKDDTLYPYDAFSSTLLGTYRTFADYNLTARTFAMPPAAPMLSSYNWGSLPADVIETVPPFGRKYLRGPMRDYSTVQAYDSNWGQNVLSPRWGYNTNTDGQQNVILYDAPRRASAADVALFSVAQLQHADLTGDDDFTSIGYQPRYAVGNSLLSPYVKADASVQSRTRNNPARVGTTDRTSGNVRMFDLSYLLNTALWDRYFFSSLAQSGTAQGTPANQRMMFANHSPSAAQLGIGQGDTLVADLSGNGTTLLPEKTAARYLLVKGSFNINSTSSEAWQAVLSGANGLPLNGDAAGVPFARSLSQSLDSQNAGAGDNDETYAGYRRLDKDQIKTLADKIVEQVRARGPFLSLSHFVNRALTTGSLGTSGALQSAIDNAAINPFANASATAKDLPTVYENTSLGQCATAAPGWLTQADILQSIGSVISARSDTFTIRTYGEVVNPLDSTDILSRAWCEAIVQRMPDYVDDTISPAAPASYNNSTLNFGRKFRVVSFRWLNPDEI